MIGTSKRHALVGEVLMIGKLKCRNCCPYKFCPGLAFSITEITRMTGMTGIARMTGISGITGMTRMTGMTWTNGMTGLTMLTEMTGMT